MVKLEARLQNIGSNVTFGVGVSISADSIEIGEDCVFEDDVVIQCRGSLRIGHHSVIGLSARFQCNNLSIGNWLYSRDGFEIGGGGCNGKDSDVEIGDRVGVFERVLINPNSRVVIGDNSGIGREVQIWTHGAWLDPLAGFPADFGPVSIGRNVWLPARTVVLPNSSIGDNSVIGINSIVNKHVPPGSFAAGCPIRIIRENAYPRQMSRSEIREIIEKILSDWRKLIEFKAPDLSYSVEQRDAGIVTLSVESCGETTYDCIAKTISGETTTYSEDLRDYLRRRGIKIFTDNYFRSI